MKCLVLVEHEGGDLKDATLAAVTAAAKLGEVHLLVAGSGIGAVAEAAAKIAELDWDRDPWHILTAALKQATGRKGKALFLPLRQALTGLDHGPEMAALLPLIGRDEAIARLAAQAAAAASP